MGDAEAMLNLHRVVLGEFSLTHTNAHTRHTLDTEAGRVAWRCWRRTSRSARSRWSGTHLGLRATLIVDNTPRAVGNIYPTP